VLAGIALNLERVKVAHWRRHLPVGTATSDVELAPAAGLGDRFVSHWRAQPARSVLADVDGRWLGGAELDERTAALAVALGGAGLAPGDRFAICAAPSAAWVIAYVAALRAGLVVVPINPAYTRVEVERIVRDAEPAAALLDDGERATWIEAAGGAPLLLGPDLAVPAGAAGPGIAARDAAIDLAAGEDPAAMLYTSGTTGAPKGAVLSHANLLASATAVAIAWRWSAEDRLLLTLPLFHMHGLGVGINGALATGAQLVLRPGFDAADVAARAGEGVSMFFAVPAIYQRLSAAGALASLRGLRLLVSGSAPLPAALAREIEREAGQLPLERYGMTETVMLTSNPYDGPRKPGKVGFPLPGVELRLSDAGEVEVRGPSVMRGYWRAPAADAEAFTADGWFRTGDVGELDRDGHLRLAGRSKELIITGGLNVHPREVEEAIATFPGVREVAVVGRPSEAWGEAVTAVVVCSGPIDAAALRAHAATLLAPYKVPKRVEFAEALPRNALGKVVRREL
jgi:malonyl-CoA/methylmalonyl-CoA synthetase